MEFLSRDFFYILFQLSLYFKNISFYFLINNAGQQIFINIKHCIFMYNNLSIPN